MLQIDQPNSDDRPPTSQGDAQLAAAHLEKQTLLSKSQAELKAANKAMANKKAAVAELSEVSLQAANDLKTAQAAVSTTAQRTDALAHKRDTEAEAAKESSAAVRDAQVASKQAGTVEQKADNLKKEASQEKDSSRDNLDSTKLEWQTAKQNRLDTQRAALEAAATAASEKEKLATVTATQEAAASAALAHVDDVQLQVENTNAMETLATQRQVSLDADNDVASTKTKEKSANEAFEKLDEDYKKAEETDLAADTKLGKATTELENAKLENQNAADKTAQDENKETGLQEDLMAATRQAGNAGGQEKLAAEFVKRKQSLVDDAEKDKLDAITKYQNQKIIVDKAQLVVNQNQQDLTQVESQLNNGITAVRSKQ